MSSDYSRSYRRLLRGAAEHLSEQWRRLTLFFGGDNPTRQMQAAGAGKELLRQLPKDALPADPSSSRALSRLLRG